MAVADAWACTNPSCGRGVSIGMLHAGSPSAVGSREVGLCDAYQFAEAFQQATTDEVEPWFALSRFDSRHRLAEIDAGILEARCTTRTTKGGSLTRRSRRPPPSTRIAFKWLFGPRCWLTPQNTPSRPTAWSTASWPSGGTGRDRPLPAPDRDHLIALANG